MHFYTHCTLKPQIRINLTYALRLRSGSSCCLNIALRPSAVSVDDGNIHDDHYDGIDLDVKIGPAARWNQARESRNRRKPEYCARTMCLFLH